MIRIIAIGVLLFVALSPNVADASARNLLETDGVQRLLKRHGEQLRRRKAYWQFLLDRRGERRLARLKRRGGAPAEPPAETARSVKRRGTLQSFAARKAVEIRQEKKHEQKAVKRESEPPEKPLPNQTFTPTLPLPELDASSHFLILGNRAEIIATVKVTPDDEPVEVRTVKVTLTSEVNSIASLEVLDEFGYVLGTAALDLAASAARDTYTLNLNPANAYFIGKDTTAIVAVRPRVKEKDLGGASGQSAQVKSITVTAIGRWSGRTNTVEPSGPDFQKNQTTLATIVAIRPDGPASGVFTTGNDMKIAAFRFEARMNKDGDPALTDLVFSVSRPGEVTLGNALIRGNDANDSHACTISTSEITCTGIPAIIGSLQAPRTISLFADVSVMSHPNPFLQISLNQPGSPDSPGAVTWSDGETGFSWVEFDSPIANGTSWE